MFNQLFENPQVIALISKSAIKASLALLLIFGSIFISKWVDLGVARSLKARSVDHTLSHFLGNVARIVSLLLGLLMSLTVFGVQSTSIAALIGASGLAIGLAFQGTLSHLASGVMLILLRPIRVDDLIVVQNHTGHVQSIGLFNTIILTFDHRKVYIPNALIFGSTIENLTFMPTRRVDVEVAIEHQADMKATREALAHAIASTTQVLLEPPPSVYLETLGERAMVWDVRVWVDTKAYYTVKESLIQNIKHQLSLAKIQTPSGYIAFQDKR